MEEEEEDLLRRRRSVDRSAAVCRGPGRHGWLLNHRGLRGAASCLTSCRVYTARLRRLRDIVLRTRGADTITTFIALLRHLELCL